MGITKLGTDYKSYSYLEAGKDYKEFDLADELNRVDQYLIPLSDEDEKRFEQIVKDNLMVSLHDHITVFPDDISESPQYTHEGRMTTAYQALASSYWDAVFDNLMDGIINIESKTGWKWTEVLHDLGMRLCDAAHQDFLVHCTKVDQIQQAHDEGKVAWIAVIEGAAMIENEVDRIDLLYGFGVRSLGVTYSESNALGSGLKEPGDGGLTTFGKRAVRRMNQVGMLIDCSHCGDQTTLDVIEYSDAPIILSHIGARALWDSNRLAPDSVLEACAKKGGLIGIEAAPHTTITPNNTSHSIESVMEHFEYIKNLVGIDHVGFGLDTLYGDHVGLHDTYSAALSIEESRKSAAATQNPPHEKVEYVKGVENPTESSFNVVRWMVKHGYSNEDIAKAIGGNAMRLLREVW